MNKALSTIMLAVSILLSLCGIAGFILLFGRDMNVFWMILAPIILAVYQIPAVAVFYFWKRRKRRSQAGQEEIPSEDPENDPK
jgi:flagellar basal body-associated protein FliL